MKRLTLYFLLLVSLASFLACGERDKGTDQHAAVRQAAEQHYRHLVDGDIDGYLHALHDYPTQPPAYRQELHDAVADHLNRELRRHGGLQSATATRDTLISTTSAYVFLDVLYADSTQEQIVLTLVEREGCWMLK